MSPSSASLSPPSFGVASDLVIPARGDVRPTVRSLPPLPRAGGSDDLNPTQRRVMVGTIAALHVVGLWGLLQVQAVRDAVVQAAPMFIDIIAPPAPPKPPEPASPPPPRPVPKTPPAPMPLIAAAPSPAPATFVVPAPPPDPAPPAPVAVVAPPAPPAPPVLPAPAPQPKMIPASAVQYLVAPNVEYPRASRQRREAGLVVVRVFINESGVPQTPQIEKSSGFVRLDEAALTGALTARFKPYAENGKPMAGWVRMPFPFELN